MKESLIEDVLELQTIVSDLEDRCEYIESELTHHKEEVNAILKPLKDYLDNLNKDIVAMRSDIIRLHENYKNEKYENDRYARVNMQNPKWIPYVK